MADIVLQLLSYGARTEREFIKQRRREGIWQRGVVSGGQAAELLGADAIIRYNINRREYEKARRGGLVFGRNSFFA